MPYAEPDQVRAVLVPDLSESGGSPAELSDAVLAERVAAASAQVDAALSARYLVPFTVPPRLVVDITVAIASWLAALTYRRSVDVEERDPLQLRYQWATDLLKAIAAGAADLPVDPVTSPANHGAAVVNTVPDLFGPDDFGLSYGPRGRYGTGAYGDYS